MAAWRESCEREGMGCHGERAVFIKGGKDLGGAANVHVERNGIDFQALAHKFRISTKVRWAPLLVDRFDGEATQREANRQKGIGH